ncbi:class I SAM-dependent methyltransferase [Pallidibacillus thermolactis]|uniref:class I SAM-dependent methyltransferase n=1 Tax=Pallidibacillus thermolactis TaxID=251051 RepID=UPI00156B5E8F|nr:class I SAM-dependent methyltransferase [Pallidibacillus thermolactis]MCU9601974.1 class I SAM-dependent methyltransferase [Pallidibacillus thermolactis subsp. kokeshiiformis]MED1672681.1 class I SAM-dependent methyltransferase [Pallidibacillus thermolactis subsp. kokeshiiformis]
MAEHYFTKKPTTTSAPKKWTYTLKGNVFRFTTNRGVFSKNEVDFGSRLLIESFEDPEIQGPILDVGCGYGPIGLALAKSFPKRLVHMIDINERAIQLALENAKNNEVNNVKIYESYLFDNVKEESFAAIVTNPPIRAGKKVVHDIFEKSLDYLKHEGTLWVVIQKKQGAPSAKKKLEELFNEVHIVRKEKGYFILKAKKIDSMTGV